MTTSTKRLLRRLTEQKFAVIIVALMIAVIGAAILMFSHAAPPFIAAEAENGTLDTSAKLVTDTTASGGKAIQFITAQTAGGTGNFSISGSKILDPSGQEYVPIGVNANGLDWVWGSATIGKSAVAHDTWKFNFLRLNSCYKTATSGSCNSHSTTNDDIASLVKEYTAKKIVVMIALHQFTGSTPDAQWLSWWSPLIAQFKDNPYVWFNPLNEPGGSTTDLTTTYTQFLDLTRNQLGAKNMVVLDTHNYSADSENYACDPTSWKDGTSFALSPQMKTLQTQYGNVMPDVHVYQVWGGGGGNCTQAQLATRFDNYINAVHAVPSPIFIGEQGTLPTKDDVFPFQGMYPATQMGFSEAPKLGIGLVYWHGDCGSPYCPMKSGSWTDIKVPAGTTSLPDCAWGSTGNIAANLQCTGVKLFNYSRSNPHRGF